MISKISSRVGARRIFVVRPNGGGNNPTPTPTPTPTITLTPTQTPIPTVVPTSTPIPTSTLTPTPTPTIFIPENDLVYILIPNNDLTYTLIPNNDLTSTLLPNNDLEYIILPLNDINYTLIPNNDLTYTLIPNNDIEYSVLKPPTVFYGEIILGEADIEGTCNCSVGECPRFYVTGDGPTFCESNIFVTNGDGFGFNGWGTIVHNGFYKTVNMDGSNIATYRTDCGTCPTTPTPTPTPTPTSTATPTPTPTPTQVCDTFTFNNVDATTTYNSATGGPNGGWTSSAYSTETYTNPVSVTFQTSNNGNYLMGGFSTNPTLYEQTYQNIRYGLYVQNEFLEIYENGGQATVPGSMVNLSTDIWKVEYDGINVKYYKNGGLIHTSSNPVTQPLHIFFALLTPNEGVTNVCVIGTPDPLPTPTETPTPTPTSTETPTPTPTETPTPTPTESPLDFTISSDCINGGAVYTTNFIGGSGVYDRGTGLYDTEAEALNDLGWIQISNPSAYVSSSVPYFNTTKTYWVALRDRNNQSNVIAKSILVDCAPTPTPTSTSTPTPTPTVTSTPTPTPTLPPLNFSISGVCQNDGSIRLSDFVGSASNNYQYTGGAHTTENSALNATFWGPIVGGNVGVVTIGSSGTYWVAVRETENPSNIIAKSVTINCVETSGLVLHYDPSLTTSYTGTGTTINDLTGQGRTGTMSNITFTSPYLTFNGTSSQISVPDSIGLEPQTGDWTIEVWVNQSVAGNDVILGKFNPGGQTQNVGYSIRTLGSSVYAQYGSGSGSGTLLFQNSASYTITPGTWYQIVYVFTNVASNTFETFVNGTSIGSISHSLSSILNTSTNLYIGSYNNGEYPQWFDGKIGIVRMYNKVLTASEILGNYNTDKSKYGL